MKRVIKITCLFLILVSMINLVLSAVHADWWGDANSWYEGQDFDTSDYGPNNIGSLETVAPDAVEVINSFANMVNVVGTTVIVLVTIFLGIKYMFGSFEAKGDVKESLLNLIVACIFFFGWSSIWNLLFSGGKFIFSAGATSYTTVVARIFNTLTNIANFLAVGAVIYIGIRYIFSGAQGKAELKGKSGQFIIGIILAFCSVGFLNYISSLVKAILG